jgi:hypothetical protein
MSSTPNPTPHLTQVRRMLKRVVDDGGYAPYTSMNGKRVRRLAASLLIKLYRGGIASPIQLESELKKQLRELMPPRHEKATALHRYAVQGLPPVA